MDSQTTVVGIIVVFKPGSYVAADARAIKSDRLSINESIITGESIPILKTCQIIDLDLSFAERSNIVCGGTFTGGKGLGVVVATGQQTEMGQIQPLVTEIKIPQTPPEIQLEKAGSQLVLLSSAVCVLVLAMGIVCGYGFIEMRQTSIALAVATVLEELPTTTTITLAPAINL